MLINAKDGRPGRADIPDLIGPAANQVRLSYYGELGTGATIITCMLLRWDAFITTTDPPGYASLFEGRPADRSKSEPLESGNRQRQPTSDADLSGNIIYVTVVMLPFRDDIL